MEALDFRSVSVASLSEMVRTGAVSSRELVTLALERIDVLDPHINAFVAVDEAGALRQAAAADDDIANGRIRPLSGIPFAVKDLEDATGFVTSSGTATRAGDPPSRRDSVLVHRLKKAGAIVVGKTNAPELGLKPLTDNPTFGITRNPWNLERTPGGSSGGSSAAVAAGLVPFATGSDGGGSIRIPSAVTGLSGMKPTLGRVPMGDPSAPGWQFLSTRGPMARRIADVALLLDLVVGPDGHDPSSLPSTDGAWAPLLSAPPPRRVAWCPTLGYATVDSEIASICESAVHLLASAGTEVVTFDSVFDVDPGPAIGAMVSTFIRRTVEPYRGTPSWNRLDPMVALSAEMSRLTIGILDLVDAQDFCHRLSWQLADVFEQVDLLLCPTVCGTTPPCTGQISVDEVLRLFGLPDSGPVVESGGLPAVLDWLRSVEPLDLPMGTINGQLVSDWTRLTQPFNMTRSPAGTVCAGLTSDGMPVGLQVVGPWLGDLSVLQAVAYLEQALEPPQCPDLVGNV
jgi:aspartyl-tRNA(Asn)/glutamyl-tRNA(Gln) amidotransferase subunit A